MLRSALAVALLVAGLPAPAMAASTTDDTPQVSLTLAAGSGIARPGEDLVVSGSIANTGTGPIAGGTLRVELVEDGLDRAELQTLLDSPADEDADRATVGSLPIAALPAGSSLPVALTVPAADVDRAMSDEDWGVHALVGSFDTAGTVLAQSSSGFVWADGEPPAPIGVATVVPFTTPGISEGLLDADSLEAYTSAGGVLRRKLDAVLGSADAIALDPRILASIRALGTEAPESAVDWLNDLRAVENFVFPLSYADSDLTLERAAGASAVLGPGSFESSLDADAFANGPLAEELPSPTTSPSPLTTPTPTPTATAEPGALPTGDELLRWDYTTTDLAWPTRVLPGDLPFYAASGLTRAIVPSSSLADAPDPLPVSGSLEGSTALVLDSELSAAVSEAAFSSGEAAGRAALANATALLTATAEEAEPGAAVLVGLERTWPESTASMAPALSALRTLPWIAPLSLDAISGSGTELAVRGDQPADERVPAATQLLQDDGAIAGFSSVLERPELLTGRERLRLLAVFSAQWLDSPEAWQTAADDLHASYDRVLHSVRITQTSVFVVSPEVPVPVFVQNDLDFPVTIRLDGRPSNGRLLVDSATATIDGQSSQRVSLPARSIANGRVTLTVTAWSPTGVQIGDPATIDLDVQAEWEAVGTSVVIGLVVALFGFGLWRNIRRRRRATREGAE